MDDGTASAVCPSAYTRNESSTSHLYMCRCAVFGGGVIPYPNIIRFFLARSEVHACLAKLHAISRGHWISQLPAH